MKAILKMALVSFFAISTVVYAGGDNSKNCKGCKQKTCTTKCQSVCGKTKCLKSCSDSATIVNASGCGHTCSMKKG